MIIDDLAVVCGLPAVLYFLFPKQVIVQRGCKCTRYRGGSMLSGCDGAERLQWSCIKTILILSKGFNWALCSLVPCLAFCLDKVSTQFSPNRRQLLNFLPIDVSCSIFSHGRQLLNFSFDFFFVFFRANTFLFFRKKHVFSEPLRPRGRIYRNAARVPYVSHFLQIPSHWPPSEYFSLFFVFLFFFEQLRCVWAAAMHLSGSDRLSGCDQCACFLSGSDEVAKVHDIF